MIYFFRAFCGTSTLQVTEVHDDDDDDVQEMGVVVQHSRPDTVSHSGSGSGDVPNLQGEAVFPITSGGVSSRKNTPVRVANAVERGGVTPAASDGDMTDEQLLLAVE